jgi:hypothetical protein
MTKRKEPTFWSTSANGQSMSGGSSYADRNRRKQASGQGCAILLAVGGSVAASALFAVAEAARWMS